MKIYLFFLTVLIVSLTSCSDKDQSKMADTIYVNGKIYTVNEDQPWAEAVAIKDGKFIKVASTADIEKLKGDKTTVIDLDGKMVMPGIYDTHVHAYEAGLGYIKCKLPGTLDDPSWEKILKTIEEAKPRQTDGWFYGEGYSAAVIPEGKHVRATLDEIFGDQPAFLQDESGHNGWFNTAAMKAAKVTPQTKVPAGNDLPVDPQTGELSGLAIEIGAMQIFKDAMPPDSDELKLDGLKLATRMANENGIVGWFEAWTLEGSLPFWDAIAKSGDLTVHTRLAPLAIGFEGVYMEGPEINELMAKYDLPGVTYGAKIFVDGTLEGGTAGMSEPSGPNKDLGSTTVDKETLERVISGLDKAGIQVKPHTIGDRANTMILEVLEGVIADRGNNDIRHHVAHASHLSDKLYQRYSKSDIGVEGNIALAAPILYLTDVIRPNCPEDIYEHHTNPWGKLMNAGVRLAGASDWSSLPFDPFYAMAAAVTRTDPTRPDKGSWSPENRLTVEQAIKVYTINGAHMMHLDDVSGSIEEGKWADFVVLSQNMFEIEPMDLYKTKPLTTIFKGHIVYSKE
jgi:predicted amidohydrolase YtcJ